MEEFELVSKFEPTGDQPQAIDKLVEGLNDGLRYQTLLGVTGSGKTFMLECVATEMLKHNQVVCFKTAFELNELARLYHIGKSYDFADCLNADILLIDDLGTEPIFKNVTAEYFLNLINERKIKQKLTIITTNLSND